MYANPRCLRRGRQLSADVAGGRARASRSWPTPCAWRPKWWPRFDSGRAADQAIKAAHVDPARTISPGPQHSRRHFPVLPRGPRRQALAPADPLAAASAAALSGPVREEVSPGPQRTRKRNEPLETYRSFNAVFTRGVKPEYRPIPADTPDILSPCDGTVQDVGRVERGRLLTVKGIEYSLDSLLPDIDIAAVRGRPVRDHLSVADRLPSRLQPPGRVPRGSRSRSGCSVARPSAVSACGVSGVHVERAHDPASLDGVGLVRGRHGRRLGCGKHHVALCADVSTQVEAAGVLSLGLASHRQTRRLDRDVRARFIGRADHVVIARGDASGFP